MRESKQIDMALMDPSLVRAVRAIGYLGSHQGALLGHALPWVDFWER